VSPREGHLIPWGLGKTHHRSGVSVTTLSPSVRVTGLTLVYHGDRSLNDGSDKALRKHLWQSISLVLIWVGAIEIAASFLAKYWLQIDLHFSPYFFAVLLIGIGMYIATRLV
jgi:hypothetical protein